MALPYQERPIADPAITVGNERYFEAAAEGKLLVKRCDGCGEVHHYPRAFCPFCFSEDVCWQEAKGTGEVYSYSITRRGIPIPYCIAYVRLDEGVLVMANIVDCDLDSVRIGQPVRVVFKMSASGTSVPMFAPA